LIGWTQQERGQEVTIPWFGMHVLRRGNTGLKVGTEQEDYHIWSSNSQKGLREERQLKDGDPGGGGSSIQ